MSILKTWKAKAAMASVLVLTALPASAEGGVGPILVLKPRKQCLNS